MKTVIVVLTAALALAASFSSTAAEPASSTGTVTERIPDVLAPAATVAAPADLKGATMVGREVCATCHAEKAEGFDKTFHGRKSLSNPKLANACESCHGAGSLHAEGGDPALILNPKKLDASATAGLCMKCHKDKALMMWKTGAHANNGVSCLTCHSVHEGEGRQSLVAGKTETCLKCHKSQQADMRLASHHPVPEGKMSCVSCHNPHGGIEGNLKADSVNETCAKCHSEKVGPFANEHPPVADNCMNCHKPHGSSNDRLMRLPVPMLCMSCHRRAHGSLGLNATQANAVKRDRCIDCHHDIHGSNQMQPFSQ
jgi:DmsE family decaheme c-type cytochrome